MTAPFKPGDRVLVGAFVGLIVNLCWRRSGVWRVLAYGPQNASNPKGRYTFLAEDAHLVEVQP